jgi:Tfp pilus assembly protein PilN
MRAVNLLPNERRDADPRTRGGGDSGGGGLTTGRVALISATLAVGVGALVGYTFVTARDDAAAKREALEMVQQQLAEAQAKAAALAQKQQPAGTALSADVRAQLDAFQLVSSQRIAWDVLLSDVSRVVPADSWLSSLTLQGPTPLDPSAPASTGVPALPTGFVASGYALSHQTVARFMQQLAKVPMLTDITLQRSERTNVGADKAFQFTLSANVRLDGSGS